MYEDALNYAFKDYKKGGNKMTNREYLNTLSDEEFANEWLKIEKMLHGDCGFHIEVIMQYLQAEHETTADEDFLKIGLGAISASDTEWRYTSNKNRGDDIEVVVTKDETRIRIFPSTEVVYVLLENNEIRTIADKKRKEMWG